MEKNIEIGLQLMLVGMVTVFAILMIVIYLGKLLIALVDKYAPEEVTASKPTEAGAAPIPPRVLAAITAAVNVITHNKGRIVHIDQK